MNDLFIRAACMDWNGVGKDSYQITSLFLSDRKRILRSLLEE